MELYIWLSHLVIFIRGSVTHLVMQEKIGRMQIVK